MSRQIGRLIGRHLARHPWQVGLAVVGIALGVAVAVSVDLANESTRRAFVLASEAVTGRATHQVIGGSAGLPEDLYRVLRLEVGARPSAPVVEGDVAAAEHPGRTFHVLGVDPFAEGPFRSYVGGDGGAAARGGLPLAAALVTRKAAVVMTAPAARELGLGLGDTLELRVAGQRRRVSVVGLLDPADRLSARALESVLITDIASAQEIFGVRGRLTRIDLIVDDDAQGRARLERIRAVLPAGAELVAAGARAGATAQMIRAFRWNLTALSLLALVVGMFLIYQTMTFSVVQRRPLIGTLRAIGVTRREIFGLVMAEALAIGAIGTLAGLALGLGMAQGLLRLVTRTINDLYFVLAVRDVVLDPSSLTKGLVLGVGATAAAALAPALEATSAPPRAVMSRAALESRARRTVRRTPWVGAAVIAAGAVLLAWPRGGIIGGFAGLFVVVIGYAFVTPGAAVALLHALQPAISSGLGLLGRLATRGIAAALSRTAVAIAALTVAVAAAIGVGVMVASFREAVARWLEGTLHADIYIAAPSLVGGRPDAALAPALAARLAATPGVGRISTSRAAAVLSADGPVRVVALGLAAGARPQWRFREGGAEAVWRGESVLVSEPFANRHGARAGGAVRLRTDRGEHEFRVAGVFYDYGSSAGVVLMSRQTYETYWDDRMISSLAIDAAPGISPAALMTALRERAAGAQDLVVRSNRALRDASLEIFDRTFAITNVVRVLTVVVAFIGMLAALMALQLERARELGVLRALGMTPRQIWGLVTAQTGLMGLLAGLLAVPCGLALAGVLIFVINRRSFGWTMPLDPSPAILLHALVLAVVAALVAGLYPAWRTASARPADALRDE